VPCRPRIFLSEASDRPVAPHLLISTAGGPGGSPSP